jgi:hypothetical protein
MARHIDDSIELFAGERREAVQFITVHADQAGSFRNLACETTRGARHVMARHKRLGRNGAPKKPCAAEDQQTHACTLRPVSSSIAGSVRATGSAVKLAP